LAIFLVLWEG
jgi:hypothetical protein